MIDAAEARQLMVDSQLLPNQITNRRLIGAMLGVAREKFLPESRRALAYSDAVHTVSHRTMPTPTAFARLVQLAEVQSSDVVLDIGCGTGYSAAVLAALASSVVAIESDATLVKQADAVLTELEVSNAAVLRSDLRDGLASEAPFDAIIVEGGVGSVPDALFKQLKDGGRLVASVNRGRTGVATVFLKSGGQITPREAFDLNLPMLSDFALQPEFAL